MEAADNKHKTHLFSGRTALVFAITIAICEGLFSLVPYWIAARSESLIPALIFAITLVMVFFIFFCRIIGERLSTFLSLGEGFSWYVGFITLAFAVIYVINGMIHGSWDSAHTQVFLITSFSALFEEILYRGILCSYSMKLVRNTVQIRKAVALNALVFGLMHLLNLLQGQSLANTMGQVLSASVVGFLFGALFVRTRSIWPGFAIHFLNNYRINIASLADSGLSRRVTITLSELMLKELKTLAVWGITMVIPAMIVLNRRALPEILRRWHRRPESSHERVAAMKEAEL